MSSKKRLTLFILMGYPIHINTICVVLSILYLKGSQFIFFVFKGFTFFLFVFKGFTGVFFSFCIYRVRSSFSFCFVLKGFTVNF